jgi:hypothetical protein
MNQWTPLNDMETFPQGVADRPRHFPARGRAGPEDAIAVAKPSPAGDLREEDRQHVLQAGLPEVGPVDEITAWWQQRLGTKSVLGQMANRSRTSTPMTGPPASAAGPAESVEVRAQE